MDPLEALQPGVTLEPAVISVVAGGWLRTWTDTSSRLWRLPFEDPLTPLVGQGRLARTAVSPGWFREVVLLHEPSGTVVLQPRFPDRVKEAEYSFSGEAFRLLPAEGAAPESAAGIEDVVTAALTFTAAAPGAALRVGPGGWTDPRIAPGTAFWRDVDRSDSASLVASPPPATARWQPHSQPGGTEAGMGISLQPGALPVVVSLILEALASWQLAPWDLAMAYGSAPGITPPEQGPPVRATVDPNVPRRSPDMTTNAPAIEAESASSAQASVLEAGVIGNVKASPLVRGNLGALFEWMEEEPEEFDRLIDSDYSKQTFKLSGFPFMKRAADIEELEHAKYWVEEYDVLGQKVRITSQWYDRNQQPFLEYLETRAIVTREEAMANAVLAAPLASGAGSGRYKAYAIGIAQNAFVRHLLGVIGSETFTRKEWEETQRWFGNSCAYCGATDMIVMDHAVPITRTRLGEHRLGNLVPSCHTCNSAKGETDYREFLIDDPERLARIDGFQADRGYVPITSPEVVALMNEAYEAVRELAMTYRAKVNEAAAGSSGDLGSG